MICTQLDDFIINKDETYWRIELNNGTMVYQDDDRPGYDEPIAWFRLKRYCEENNLYPIKMWITFRSHTEFIGESKEGFFFSRGAFFAPLMNKTQLRYICGPIINGQIHTKIWNIPEIINPTIDGENNSEIRPMVGNEEKCISRLLTDMNAQTITT